MCQLNPVSVFPSHFWSNVFLSLECRVSVQLPPRTEGLLTLILLTWRIWWAANNASRWQMGFNSAFQGLNLQYPSVPSPPYGTSNQSAPKPATYADYYNNNTFHSLQSSLINPKRESQHAHNFVVTVITTSRDTGAIGHLLRPLAMTFLLT